MDPNENRKRIRALVAKILDAADGDDTDIVLEADAIELAELVSAQDEWLCNGGLAPSAWKKSA